jgi:DNA replication protein DnaC
VVNLQGVSERENVGTCERANVQTLEVNTVYRFESAAKCEWCGMHWVDLRLKTEDDLLPIKTIPGCACAQRVKRLHEKIGSSVLMSGYRRMTFGSFDVKWQESAFRKAKAYVETIKTIKDFWFVLRGETGTGKTHLAAAICNELIEKRHMFCVMHSMPELMYHIRQGAWEATGDLLECDMLVLDDFGRGNLTDWVIEQYFILVDGRHKRQLPMVITTNYDASSMEKMLGSEIVRRIVRRIVDRSILVVMKPVIYLWEKTRTG